MINIIMISMTLYKGSGLLCSLYLAKERSDVLLCYHEKEDEDYGDGDDEEEDTHQ